MKNTILLENVKKSFGEQQVLKGINLHVSLGKIVGLIGPSGAGKSTIIKTTLGMEVTDSGIAEVFGQRLPNRKLLNRIGYMAQSDALYTSLTGYANLEFFASMKGVKKSNINNEIIRVAKVVDLTEALKKTVSGYSGGMMRRLSLAISLLDNPQLLVLDEPTVGIDPALRLKIWDELRKLADNGTSILITTHVMDEAEKVDDVALLLDGKVIDYDTPKELKTKYKVNSVEEAFLKAEGDL
ncbi:ABC transporter ATP-binding protein [Apilactobacillus micheneri]|uniref:ABC transporter ATP-binding protein n=1 Tax=Apilactobacillus micheneri TaxID=1899430 RepID=A0A9Q8MTE8_9LACO|nr:ABC transporter ATP-binding protein [Apilactobacillus micheneri]TPR39184.1 ABC transporter ATP-binding protein [Apilactobacillus micheneri]TPR43089.1 ABC transporter ATP-binding protein [Apilactobacillus micheneri]TPR44069.1 ABC transporter ATP-binding protein [Apilactobacillus micheneri]